LAQPGTIRDTAGNAVGTHEGYFHYTIGQRKKIQIATTEKRYVTRIIPEKNEIVVGSDDDLLTDNFEVTDVNWVAIDPTANPPQAVGHPYPALIKIRYLHKPVAGELQVLSGGDVKVHLSQKQRAVTPGQSCVFYDGDVVLGGGKIV
jgi:tRNA-specific 2-thiouridylase